MPFLRKRKMPTEKDRLQPHFDSQFYLARYPEVADVGIDPLQHYLDHGAHEGLDPAPWFSTNGYLKAHPDVALAAMNPFLHYIDFGRLEGRALPWLDDALDPSPDQTDPDASLDPRAQEIAEQDLLVPKHDNWWVFPACAYDHNLSGNDRAVFEAVRHDPMIRKIVLTRGRDIDLDGANVDIYPLMSADGQEALLGARVIFIKHSPGINVVFPISPQLHLFIGLWHGIPFKRIGTASIDNREVRDGLIEEHAKLACVISSSQIDRLAMAAGFQPLSFDDVWITGLPRHDFIRREFSDLPEDFQREEQGLRELLDGKKLILLCPTFRKDADNPGYRFSPDEVERLNRWLEANDAVMGIREHMADRQQAYSSQLKGSNFLSLPASRYPNIEVLYRSSDCLVTDYSSCFFDFMLTGKAAISLAYDLEAYSGRERGTFYDLDAVFPGPVCRDSGEMIDALDAAAKAGFANTDPLREIKRRMFFSFDDGHNTDRVIRRVKRLLRGESARELEETSDK